MSMFQKSVEKKYLNELDSSFVDKKYTDFQNYFGNPERQENIKNAKEEQFQEGFLRELFVNILGYTLNPELNFNLTTELKNITNSKKADGAILKSDNAHAVIELKSTNTTDLDSIETQAFGYKNHHPKCVYVITSNFEKLRFYIQNAVDHIDFDLFNLTKEQFSLMWLCLAKDNLLNDLPLKIKDSSVLQEENITKKLYADYSKFRTAIFNNLIKNNPDTDKLLLFKKTQKLLDRFLFIFFAEDRLLLPPNSISEIVKQWKTLKDELDEYVPLYARFKKYFGYMNTGFKGKKYDIYAYNGGLFKPDEILDNILIDDDVLHEHTVKLSNYDFETDVDVNILGHIFEHSLGEIENVQAEIKGEKVDSQKTRRKKDGIFYTPKYITKYIVENTVGKLCNEKRNELQIIDEEYAKGRKNRKKEIVRTLDKKLDEYRNWLLTLTILDPACGSGAFLNQALEFLINEHQKIDELRARLFGGAIIFSDSTTDILEKNIFGVDINEESVDIAKLSLWLRTAQKGRKLNTLSNNIKCGNSLIDDPEIAGDKAFNWRNEFSEIFANGGFDVVIGNPPYGAKLDNDSKDYLGNKYISFNKNYDVYSAFMQLAFRLIKDEGFWGYINPVSWQSNENYFDLRNYLKKNGKLEVAIKLPYDVFADAYVDTGIYIIKKQQSNSYNTIVYDFPVRASISVSTLQFVTLHELPSVYWTKLESLKIVLNPYFYELLPKLFNNSIALKELTESVRGILPNKEDVTEVKQNNSKPYFIGNLYRYDLRMNCSWVNYGANLKEKPKKYDWFTAERILVRRLINRQFRVMGSITSNEFVNKKDIYVIKSNSKKISSYFLLTIINSSLVSFLKTKGSTNATKDDFSQLTLNDLREIPIKLPSDDLQMEFTEKVKPLLSGKNELQKKKSKFINRLIANLEIEKISNKLDAFFDFDFKIFLSELKKQKVILSLTQQDEWEEYFNNYKSEINQLQSEIEKTDKEIDQMVYELYGLTEEEIKIVENS